MIMKRCLVGLTVVGLLVTITHACYGATILQPTEVAETYNYNTAGGQGPTVPYASYERIGTLTGGPDIQKWAWVKYDLSAVEGLEILSASITPEIMYFYPDDTEVAPTNLHLVHNDSWYEAETIGGDGICWVNQPTDFDETPLDSVVVDSYTEEYSWNVTEPVRNELTNDRVISFLFRFPDYDHWNNTAFVKSSLNLSLETANPVPEPTSLALWSGLGVMGLIAARRRRRTA